MARAITKHDMVRNIAYISYDTVSDLYTLWYKTTTLPKSYKYSELPVAAKEYLNKAHRYSYGVSTYYRMEK